MASRVISIGVRGSKILAKLISQLLVSCEAITSFRYQTGCSSESAVQWNSDVVQAVGTHFKTIRDLAIDAVDCDTLPWQDQWPSIDVFASFPVLTRLEFNYSARVGKPVGLYNPDVIGSVPVYLKTSSPALRKLLPLGLRHLSIIYERSSMNRDVDYNAEIRGLLVDDLQVPRALQ